LNLLANLQHLGLKLKIFTKYGELT